MKSLTNLTRTGLLVPLLFLRPLIGLAQDCTTLNFTCVTQESRCMATGTIQVNVTGGSGSYNIKVTGPTTTAYTSSSTITGLAAGSYTVSVKDIKTNCVTDKYNIMVAGSYSEPRFVLNKTDVTCMNGTDGTVTVSNLLGGRGPFTYTIVAPSPTKVGTSNSTGQFTNLIAGEYAVQLKDSCGGQQTRRITILNYQWWIDGYWVTKVGCDSAQVTVKLKDSKGNTTLFNGFNFGVVRAAGDTVWSGNSTFKVFIGKKRSVKVVIKDPCGTMQVTTWVDPNIPKVNANVNTNNLTCNDFGATVTGQANLTNPEYRVYNSSNVQVAFNTTGTFTGLPYGNYYVDIKDNCYDTTIRRYFSATRPKPELANNITISNRGCKTFTAAVTGMKNFTPPVTYGLYSSSNVLITTSPDGVFNNIPYGQYKIRVKDGCYDTTIIRNVNEQITLPSLAPDIVASNFGCNSFTGSVAAQVNLTDAEYCLYRAGVKIGCNTSGIFGNLEFGVEYCIRATGNPACYDTTIERCITLPRQRPGVGQDPEITPGCTTFNVRITGQQYVNNPNYCLYNASGAQVGCNNTGEFNNLPYGYYCIRMTNDANCYDTVIERCFNPQRLRPTVSTPNVSNKGCNGVTVKLAGTNLTNAKYVLYNSNGVAIDSNTTGNFNNAPYGYNCIRVRTACYDTLIERCYTAKRDIPSAGTVDVSNRSCNTFTAKLSSIPNVKNPQYAVYDTLGNFVAGNTNGTFNNLPYGYYEMRVRDTCYDTTIVRRFNADPNPITIGVTAKESCTFGTTDLRVTFSSGNAPYTVQVYNPVGVLVTTTTSATSPVLISALQPLTNGQQYRVVGLDNCSGRDTDYVTPKPSLINKTKFVKSKCPSGVWENGATDIDIDVSSNMGTVTPVIIKKNNVANTINFTNNVGTTYKFVDLEPATYIVQYTVPNCTGRIYDTVEVAPYAFPGLQQSAAYQCDNNNFSVGAVVTGGCSPFSYEVIGSIPESPSIISSGQTSPVFTITNGVQYSLVRLRAVDACGNATLNDVNILPLANTIVYASSDCYYNDVTLQVDSTANATYTWYKKTTPTDSVLVSNSTVYRIPYLLPSDTGTYVCHMSVNGGCLTKLSYFTVTGMCSGTLPGQVRLTGKEIRGQVQLNWEARQDEDTREYVVERSGAPGSPYTAIGKVYSRQSAGRSIYAFTDEAPLPGNNYYRLRIVSKAGQGIYSNLVAIKASVVNLITLYPNPVKKVLNIALSAKQPESYRLTLSNATGQVVHEQVVQKVQQTTVQYQRDGRLTSGIYLLRVTALGSPESFVYKVVFE